MQPRCSCPDLWGQVLHSCTCCVCRLKKCCMLAKVHSLAVQEHMLNSTLWQAAAAEVEKPPEKTEFDVKLTGYEAAAKIKIIKEVRGVTSLGLKEAKELVRFAGHAPACRDVLLHQIALWVLHTTG